MLDKIRAIKSPEEMTFLEKAAELGDLMLRACSETARPGVRECEVYAKMREAMLANGGEEPTLFLWASDAHPLPTRSASTSRPSRKGILSRAKCIQNTGLLHPRGEDVLPGDPPKNI